MALANLAARAVLGDAFLTRSFLFEVVDSKTEIIQESFTLVLPPQSYSIKEKHRVNITKTFGNAFVDDYGPDNLELTIKGLSGTATAFPTFNSKGKSKGDVMFANNGKILAAEMGKSLFTNFGIGNTYDHKEAFYYFRDKIMRYKDKPGFDGKELRVYDLADEQGYKCVLLEFSVDRSSDKPLHYPFTINLFVYARMGSADVSKSKYIKLGKDPLQALDNIMYGIERFKRDFVVFRVIQTVQNSFTRFERQAKRLRRNFRSWLVTRREVLESPLVITRQSMDSVLELSRMLDDAKAQGLLLESTYAQAKENVQSQWNELKGIYGFAVEDGVQVAKTATVTSDVGSDYGDAEGTDLEPDETDEEEEEEEGGV